LKAEQKIKVQLDKWPDHLDKWGDPPDGSRTGIEEDRACIMFKRDARTLLGDEQLLVCTQHIKHSVVEVYQTKGLEPTPSNESP